MAPALSTSLPDYERVEVLQLGDTVALPLANTFPIRGDQQGSDSRHALILSRKTLTGPGATELCGLWRKLTFDLHSQAKEQAPDFALRFYRADTLEFETSISFRSSNFSYSPAPGAFSFHGFLSDGDSKALEARLAKIDTPNPKGGD
ncbi:hypothetical protein [Luteolibacter luteus]|uniref:Uncharacterized protein n=1 Tax=Luteolibacter luteus TaxID=2728835 RepID=A0A858REU6_9BACT|nr:hypothetical protein [Luteolibacter luteus]QJE94830.1 hypothetical protein HHL09_03235 [Luteolibacter luteus]